MGRTRIKICGVTRVDDALAAVSRGADAIGMVFYPPAPRSITLEKAREILKVLASFVTPVALFVDADATEIRSVVEPLGIRHIQLHGHETPQVIAQLTDRVVLKAIRVQTETMSHELAVWRQAIVEFQLSNLRGLVLETAGPGIGGTGVENNWTTISTAQQRGDFDGLPPIIAAGGLKPENVADVIQRIRPHAVDVSSGVEVVRGCKSVEKLDAFFAAVRLADHALAGVR